MQEWELEFWEKINGNSPAEKDFEELRKSDKVGHDRVRKKIKRYLQRPIDQIINAGDLEDLKNGLWELKISAGKIEYRFLGVLTRSLRPPLFEAFMGFKKKEQKLRQNHVKTGLIRLGEYLSKKRK